MSSWVLIVIRCIFFVITIQTNYTGTVSEPLVNFSKFETLITRSKSILIRGNKLDLDIWFRKIGNQVNVDNDTHLIIAFSFIKCECADYLKELLRVTDYFLSYCPAGDKNDLGRCSSGITWLISLEDPISTALTKLFEIVQKYPNLKSHERHFARTLLMAFMFINKIKQIENKINTNDYMWKRYDVNGVRSKQAVFIEMRRVALQIANLVQMFMIEFCYSYTKNVYNDDTREHVTFRNVVLNDFRYFLRDVVSYGGDSLHRPIITMNDIRLQKCMTIIVDGASEGEYDRFCSWLLRDCSVQIKVNDETHDRTLSAQQLFTTVKGRHDVESTRQYILTVYNVLWKRILRETTELWKNNSPLWGVDDGEGIISKLKSTGCPTELVDHFEFALKVQNYKNERKITDLNAQEIGKMTETRADRINNVQLHESADPVANRLSLTEVINVIVSDEFKTFWLLLDLLRDESETYSAHSAVYDYPLDLDLKDVKNQTEKEDVKTACDELDDLNLNFFILQTMYADCLSSGENYTNCYKEIRSGYDWFLNMLLPKFDKFYELDKFQKDSDLEKIMLATVIHLRNAFNSNNNDPKNHAKQLCPVEQKRLKRKEDFILNLVDNYRIRHCRRITNHDELYKNVHDNDGKIQPLKNVFENWFDNISNDAKKMSARIEKTTSKIRSHHHESGSHRLREHQSEMYSIAHLTGNDSILQTRDLAERTLFYWHGESKSIYEIQIDITENMLNLHDLVVYQNLFVRWAFYVFYYFWFAITEDVFNNNANHKKKLDVFDKHHLHRSSDIKCILDFNTKINEHQKYFVYQKYGDICHEKLFFTNILCGNDDNCRGHKVAEMVKEETLNPMTKLLLNVGFKYSNNINYKSILNYNNDHHPLTSLYSTSETFVMSILSTAVNQFILLDLISK